MKQPKIEVNGKEYYQVGCKDCGKGEDWNIYFDGKQFVFQCKCGNTLEHEKAQIQNHPNEKPIPLRMVI